MELTAMRRIIAALTLVALCGSVGSAQKPASPDAQLGAIIKQAEVEHDFNGAIPRYTKFIAENGTNGQLAAKALYYLGLAYEKTGNPAEARTSFERVAKQFSTQKEAPFALEKLGGGVPRETTVKISGTDNIGRFFRPSPDGRYLVGPRDAEKGNRYLVLHDLSTNADRRLTREGFAHNPQFTPDGRRVVFQWAPSGPPSKSGGIHEIRMVNVDGTGERTLFRSTLYQFFQVSGVSADGKTAAVGFQSLDNTWQVGLVSLETAKVTILKNNELRDTYVGNFSPDGRWLVYWMQSEKWGDGGIYVVATDGSAQHSLIPAHATPDPPRFSPDGSRVVFVSGGRQELWSIAVADGTARGAQEIVSSGGYTELLGFSRDGSLYFTQDRSHNSLFVADVNPTNWKSLGAPTEVSTANRGGHSMATAGWSRDGQVLAYQSVDDRSNATIVLHRFDGAPDRELSFTKSVALYRWSSDGRLLMSSGRELNFYDVDTGREQPFLGESKNSGTEPSFDATQFGTAVARDESALYYFTEDREPVAGQPTDAHTVRLMRLDVRTGERRELHHLVAGNRPPRLFRMQVSPDGSSLGFGFPNPGSEPDSPSQSGVLVPLSGGEPRLLPGFAAWTSDGKAVLFEKSRGDIWVQPIAGGEMYATGIRFDKSWDLLNLFVHPDGRHLAMSWRVNTHDVSVIGNLLSKR
jgi:Tol biopolymer transport system component